MKTMKIKHGGKNVGDSANFISAIKYIREVAYGSPLGSLKEAKDFVENNEVQELTFNDNFTFTQIKAQMAAYGYHLVSQNVDLVEQARTLARVALDENKFDELVDLVAFIKKYS